MEKVKTSCKQERICPKVIIRSNTTLSAKVNKYVTVILNVQLINEKQITPRTQVKETLSLGLSYTPLRWKAHLKELTLLLFSLFAYIEVPYEVRLTSRASRLYL
jgi:hypothetical protein